MRRSPLLLLLLVCALAAGGLAWQQCAGPSLRPDGGPTPQPAAATPEQTPPAQAPASAPTGAMPPRIDVGADRKPAEPTSALADAAQGVHGRVVDAHGGPIAGAHVALFESHQNDPIGHFLSIAQDMPRLATATGISGADGTFALGTTAAGDRDHDLNILADGFAGERVGQLRVHPGEWLDLGDVVLHPGTTITGRVTVAGTDLPVPQATVWLETGNPFLDLGVGQSDGWQQRRSATVGADGRYALRHAPRTGLFRLLAQAPGFGRQIHSELELTDGAPIVRDFELPRGLSLQGALRGPDGPVAAAQVIAYAKNAEPAFRGVVGSDGRFFVHGLREGPHLLKITADGFQPHDLDGVAAGTQDLLVDLVPRGRASVVVFAASGQLVHRYRLAVRRWYAEGGHTAAVRDVPERVVQLQPGTDATTVTGLDPGTYVFQVYADGHASTLSAPWVVAPGEPPARVEVTLVRGGALHGTVAGPAGEPVRGARITTQPDGAAEENPVWKMLHSLTPDRITRATADTDANGHFELRGLAHAPYQLQIDHPDYCRHTVRDLAVDGDGRREVPPIRLVRGAAVRGTALVDGAPAPQVRVVLTPEAVPSDGTLPPPVKSVDETTVVRVEAVTNNDGSFELPRRIPPGVYDLRGFLHTGNDPAAEALQNMAQMQQSAVKVTVLAGQDLVVPQLRLTTNH
ncbi:MAG: carboxypeptidase-like regulatory domain-containing protein [Planctomycetota bacterium]